MRRIIPGAVLLTCLFWLAVVSGTVAASQDSPSAAQADAAAKAEDDKQRLAAERFLTVLEKTPRRGTALDRLYGYHVEAGTLDQFVKRYADRTAKDARDGSAWMILGLIESQRGRDAAAVSAFQAAEKALPENALAAYYLGQSLVLVGQPEEAAAAFERAIGKKPARPDLLDLFQALGRVYQRAQKTDQALAVWSRLEKLFPDDLRVQEQIATTLAEEGQPAQALPRFEALAAKVKDEYRAATYRVEAAEIKVRLGKTKEALADFEGLLAKLNPDNWLYRDVRRRIEETFLHGDDQAGLAAYYETWIGKNAEDVEAMARLGRLLAGLGRAPEAQKWFDKALKLAPSRKDLRLALIEQLVTERQYGPAVRQYEQLAKNDPNNPDAVREWGRLILKDTTLPEAERKKGAAAVWRRLVEARPNDSLTATQVADLFRQVEMVDEALVLYQKAVSLSPDATQYREYLGEYYHTLKRSDEALAVWRGITAGKKRTPENLARLAEVLAGFGYLDEAVENILAACQLDDDEFKYPLKAADLLSRAEKYEEALRQLDTAEKLAGSPEDGETVLQQRIRNLQLADTLEKEIATLQQNVPTGKEAASYWYRLARYLEAARNLPDAARALDKALALDDKSIVYRTAQARIHESSGNVQLAADAYRMLATIDRRFRTGHLTNVAKLEAQLGRIEPALQAGRDLLAAAPGNPENYEFYAQLCFQLGKTEEGLEALRRSVRLNPTEAKLLLTLANALAEQFRTDEAIELYWRAFDKANDLEGKLPTVSKLADLYLQTNHFDRLVERLDRLRREANASRELTICLAQAYQSAGDFGTARQELERLLTQNVRDTQLLQQLSNLAESEGDFVAAAKFQQQLLAVTPGKEVQIRLAQLLMRTGETDAAAEIWQRITVAEDDPEKILRSVDSLLAHDKRDTARPIIDRLLRDQPKNWELLYRSGAALGMANPEEAAGRVRALLALRLPDDEAGIAAKSRLKQAQQRTGSAAARAVAAMQVIPAQQRSQSVYQVRQAAGFTDDRFAGRSVGQSTFWGPHDFGMARMAAIAWLLRIAEGEKKQDEFVAKMRKALDAPTPDAREQWDWLYLQQIRQDEKEMLEATRRMSRTGDPNAQWMYLSSLSGREGAANRRVASTTQADATPPLPAEEVDDMLAWYKSLKQKRSELFANSGYYGLQVVNNVITELKRAQRTDEEAEIYRTAVADSDRPENFAMGLQMAARAAISRRPSLCSKRFRTPRSPRSPACNRPITAPLLMLR